MTVRPNKVPILEVLDKLWYTYWSKWADEYWVFDKWEKTDWWSANKEKNRLTDFSNDRPNWEPRGVVKMHYNLINDDDIFKWFIDNFPTYAEDKPVKENVQKIRDNLPTLTKDQIEYLKKRGIEHEKVEKYVKNYQWSIGCMVYVNKAPVWINARKINDDGVRFTALKWYDTNGIYYWWLDNKKDYVIVVEWLIDFLTLKQYETNVVGLKSLQSWYDEVIKLAKDYKLRVVFDNDWKEEEAKKRLQSVKYSFFNWDIVNEVWYTCKDANDIHEYVKDEVVNIILSNQIEQTPIYWTIERYRERQKIIKERWKLGDDWPYQLYNLHTQWIVKWKVYTIGAFSNVGKSKFAYSHVPFFLKQWEKVMYISMEESELDIFWNIACAYYWQSISEQWNLKVNYKDFENLICIDSAHKTDEIKTLVELHKPDRVFIDYIQAIFEKWSQYEKGALVALAVQKIAIEFNCTVFSLSQLSNDAMKEVKNDLQGGTILLKWAWEYYAASDVILVLQRTTEWWLVVKVEKNKLWKRWFIYPLQVERDKNIFTQWQDITHMYDKSGF